MPDVDPYLHTVLNQRYRLEEALGGGSFGQVYRAAALPGAEPRPDCCIRLFAADDPTRDVMLNCFEAVAPLKVPYVLPWLEIGVVSTGPAMGHTFLATPRGDSLRTRLTQGPLGTEDLLQLTRDLATALESLHEQALVYLKLAPSNIMQHGGHWWLADRDTLRSLGTAWLDDYLASADPYYVAPELWRRQYLPQVDVWALGLVLLECLRGRLPYVGPGLLYDVTRGQLPLPEDLPSPFDLILRGCLTSDPGRRWSVTNVLAVLNQQPLVLDTSWRSPYATASTTPVQAPPGRLTGHLSEVRAVAFSPVDDTLVSGASDGSLHVWDIASGRFQRLSHHKAAVRKVLFDAQGGVLATACQGGEVAGWDVASRTLVRSNMFAAPVTDLLFERDLLIVLLDDGSLWTWNWRVGQPKQIDTLFQATGVVHALRSLVWGRLDGQLQRGRDASRATVVGRHRGPVSALVPTDDGLYSVALDGTVLLSGQPAFDVPSDLWCLAWKPDAVAVAGQDRMVYLWRGPGDMLCMRGHTLGVTGVSFHHGGRLLASASRDRNLILWELKP